MGKGWASIKVIIDNAELPKQKKLEETKKRVIKEFGLKGNLKIDALNKGSGRVELIISVDRKVDNEPILAALETFLQFLGNIRIYQKSIKYRRE